MIGSYNTRAAAWLRRLWEADFNNTQTVIRGTKPVWPEVDNGE